MKEQGFPCGLVVENPPSNVGGTERTAATQPHALESMLCNWRSLRVPQQRFSQIFLKFV